MDRSSSSKSKSHRESCVFCSGTVTILVLFQVRDRVPKLRGDLQKQAVLVRKPGPSGNSGQNRDPAHLAWGENTVEQPK